jgi:DNA-binding CsgD family transcriptional regulator
MHGGRPHRLRVLLVSQNSAALRLLSPPACFGECVIATRQPRCRRVFLGLEPSNGELTVTGGVVTGGIASTPIASAPNSSTPNLSTPSRTSHALASLTTRQLEVLVLMAEGRSNAGIAAELHLSEKAVVQHTSRIYSAFDLPVDAEDNRRVLAVLRFLAAASDARRTG